MKRSQGVRIGPISLFTLVSVLALAVLAVLVWSTGNALSTLAERQAKMNTEAYLAESMAQEMLSQLDLTLAEAKGTDQKAALSAVEDGLSSILLEGHGVSCDGALEGNELTASYTTASGRHLDVVLSINDDLSYSIKQWKMTAQMDESNGETLWSSRSN